MHVVVQTQADNLDHHLYEEDPRKEIIETREDSLLLQTLGVVIHCEHDGIGQNEYEHDEVIEGVVDECIDFLVYEFGF